MGIFGETILVAGAVFAALSAAGDAVADANGAAPQRGVALRGRVGEKASELFESRLVGDKAKGDIFGSTVATKSPAR